MLDFLKRARASLLNIFKHSKAKYFLTGACAVLFFCAMFICAGPNNLAELSRSGSDNQVTAAQEVTSSGSELTQASLSIDSNIINSQNQSDQTSNQKKINAKEVSEATGIELPGISEISDNLEKPAQYIEKNDDSISDVEWLKQEIQKEELAHSREDESSTLDSGLDSSFESNPNEPIATAIVNLGDEVNLWSEGDLRKLFADYREILEVNFNQDIKLNSRLEIMDYTNCKINMNGHMLRREIGGKGTEDGEVIVIRNHVNVEFNGGPATPHTVTVYTDTDFHNTQITLYGGVICGGKSYNGAGGIHCWAGSNINFKGVTIAGCRSEQNNYKYGNGGGIYVNGDNTIINFQNSNITGCAAYNDGGGICVGAPNTEIDLTDSHIDNNYARDCGGGICSKADKVYVFGNTQQGDYSGGSSLNGNATGCYWSFPLVPNDKGCGTGIYNNGDHSVFSGLNIAYNNTQFGSGGGVLSVSKDSRIMNCNIYSNSADEYGGGVCNGFLEFNELCLSVISCSITGNKAKQGGGVSVTAWGGLSLSGLMRVHDNTSSKHGADDIDLLFEKIAEYDRWQQGKLKDVSVSKNSWVGIVNDSGSSSVSSASGTYNENCFFSNEAGQKIVWISKNDGGDGNLNMVPGQEQKSKPEERVTDVVEPYKSIVAEKYNGYDIQKGSIQYVPFGVDDTSDFVTDYYYSDGYFDEQPDKYNTHLATLSVLTSCAGYGTNAGNSGTESALEDGNNNYLNKFAHLSQLFSDIGCSNDSIAVNDAFTKKPTGESIGVVTASKEMDFKDGSKKTLVPVAIRGGGYEREWASNCTINPNDQGSYTDGEHTGFSQAATQVVQFVNDYIKANNLTEEAENGNLIFWLTGYSRAGATANLVSKRLTDTYGKINEDNKIFAYCTEPPKGGCESAITAEQRDASYTYNGEYKNIHNIVNACDLVPNVAPTEMGFKRYGIMHYLPGSDADGQERPAGYDETSDNQEYPVAQIGDSAYYKQKLKMKEILTGVNMYLVFDDYFHLAQVNYIKGYLQFTDFVAECGGWGNLQAKQFNKDLLTKFQEWGNLNRTNFSKDIMLAGINYKSVQECLRQVTKIIFGKNQQDLAGIAYSVGFIKERLPKMMDLYKEIIGVWDKVDDPSKVMWLEKLTSSLIARSARYPSIGDYLTDEEYELMQKSLPSLLNAALFFETYDYQKHALYGTTDSDYQIMVGTALYNLGNILKNHYQDVTMSWAMSFDDYYTDRPQKSRVLSQQHVEAPIASYYNELTGQTETYNPGDTIEIGTNKTLQLLPKEEKYNGSAFYYVSGDRDPKNPNDTRLYSRGITFDDVLSTREETIKVVAMQYGSYSEVCTFNIKNLQTRYNAKLSTVDDDGNKIERTETFKIGQTAPLSTTQCFEGNDFTCWKVVKKSNVSEDVTDLCIPKEQQTLKVANFTMPQFDCIVFVNYVRTNINIVLTADTPAIQKAAIIGQPLLDKMTATYYKDGVEVKNVPLKQLNPKWTVEGKEPEQNIAQPDTTYVMNLEFEDNLHDLGISFGDKTSVCFYDTSDPENVAKVSFDKSTKKLNTKFTYTIGHNYYLNTPYPGYVYVPNMYSKEQTIEQIKKQLPKQIEISTSMGLAKADVTWKNFTYEPGVSYTYIALDSEKITLPENVFLQPEVTEPDKATLDVYVGFAAQAMPPSPTVAEGTYRGTYSDPFTLGLQFDAEYKERYQDLAFKYCPVYSVKEGDKTIWYKYTKDESKEKVFEGEEPDPYSFKDKYDTYNITDKVKLSALEGTVRDIRVYCYTDEGASKGVEYYASFITCYNYSITWMKTFNSEIKSIYVDGKQAAEPKTVTHMQNDSVTLAEQHTAKEEFDHWEQAASDPQQIIDEYNKNNPSIYVDQSTCEYHLTAVYKPVIQDISLVLYPLEPGEIYPLLYDNLSVSVDETYQIPNEYAKIIYYDWNSSQSDENAIVPFNSSTVTEVFIDFTQEDLKDIAAKVSDNVKISVSEKQEAGKLNANSLMLDDGNTQLKYDYYYELITEGERAGALKNLSIFALMTTTRKADLLSIKQNSFTTEEAYKTAADQFKLPKSVDVSVEDESITTANIQWDMEELKQKYDTATLDDQEFTISGKVQIPDSINNKDKSGKELCNLNVTCLCKVAGAPYTTAAVAKPESGAYTTDLNVYLSTETEAAQIWYKVDSTSNGADADDEEFVLYDGTPVNLCAQAGTQEEYAIKTKTIKDGYRTSTANMHYLIDKFIYVEDVTLDKTNLELKSGESTQITATVWPMDATVQSVTWKSTNPDVVSVEQDTQNDTSLSATITAKSVGEAQIIVTSEDENPAFDICDVKVVEVPAPKPDPKPDPEPDPDPEYVDSVNDGSGQAGQTSDHTLPLAIALVLLSVNAVAVVVFSRRSIKHASYKYTGGKH